tara:strand:- start:14035 stop:15645 length:1611 start_codon:yes stop_codon:yes gene_type:complete
VKKTLTDIEFIAEYDGKVGELYNNAKSVYTDAPIQTLVEIRNILEYLTDQIIQEHSLEPIELSLHSKINTLKENHAVGLYIIDRLHELRAECNKAAHKHEYNFSYDEFSELALKVLKSFCDLIEDIQISANHKVNRYSFIKEVDSRFRELSYKVMFEEDKEAKYLVGLALIHKYSDQFNDKTSYYVDNRPLTRGLDLLEESAKDRHPEAMFEYGYILINGYNREKDIKKGVAYLHDAGSCGLNKGKSHYADFELKSSDTSTEDAEYALELLHKAVEDNDSYGQFLLSKLHKTGRFVPRDEEKSIILLGNSANGGCTEAMYEYGKYLIEVKEDGVKGGKYLQEAVLDSYSPAWLYAARNSAKHDEFDKTVEWYEGYLKINPADYDVYIELSEYIYSKSSLNVERIYKALGLLVNVCRLPHCPAKIKSKTQKLSPSWLDNYSDQLAFCGSNKDYDSVFFNFDPNGRVIEDLLEVGERLTKAASDPRLMERLIYLPTNKRELLAKATGSLSNKTSAVGRNEPCPCNSGKKYKQCCRLVS